MTLGPGRHGPCSRDAAPLDPARLGDHVDRLYRAAWAFCGNRQDAEDLVQETYARVLARPRLFAITTISATSCARCGTRSSISAHREPSGAARSAGRQLRSRGRPGARDPQAALEVGELYAAIAALPDHFRDVLVAVDVTGLSYKEAARALRIREGTVMSRLFRARQQVVRTIEGTPT